MSKPITISIVGNAGPLKKSLREADDAMSSFGEGLKKFGLAAAAGVGTLAAGIGFAAKAAAEDQKSFALMETAIRNVTGATHEQIAALDEQIGAMSLATGVADDKLRPAFAALTRGTRDVEESTKQMTLVLDIATALQMDATTIADALAKGYEGNMRALRGLSPEMAQMIKDGASMNDVLDQLSANFGGASAAAADTFEGRMARLNVAMSEIVEQIGYAFLPMLEKIAAFIADRIVPVVQEFADAFSERGLGGVLDLTREKLFSFYSEADFATKAMINATVAAGALFVAMKTLAFIQTVTALVNGLTLAINNSSVAMGRFAVSSRTMAATVAAAFAAVSITLEGLSKDQWQTGRDLMERVAEFVNLILAGIEKVAEGTNYTINTLIRGYNAIPFLPDISYLPESVTIGRMRTDFQRDTGPSAPAPTVFPGNTRETAPIVIPPVNIPGLPGIEEPAAGGGGGGGGGRGGGGGGGGGVGAGLGEGFIQILPSTEVFGGGGGGFGAAMGNEALLDGLTGGSIVNVTVNTVSADANLPNLIVEALQTYNLTSGPIDVAIAV